MNANQIPMMFRAQIEGRCQIQRLPQAQQDSTRWVDEWVEAADENIPTFSKNVQTQEYEITWRFVTNSGQDEGIIRPVIGANGFPYYPGSSMKGSFWRACPPEDRMRYCGGEDQEGTHPGILRFHGGYPKDLDWIEEELVDVIHPQQDWQIKTNGNHSAFVQISLYKPVLVFGISSNQTLTQEEWQKIWQIWDKAIGKGIGTRVSAGYGQPKQHSDNCLLSVHLKGQGLASKLINNTGEFRPNMFKAALRGHTLRLFGGVTDEATAEALTKEIWGGFNGNNGAIVGQVGISFDAIKLTNDDFTYRPGHNPFNMPIYDLKKGRLNLLRMKDLSQQKQQNLQDLLQKIIKFSLLLGGVGKSWRRVDHRIFFSDYFKNGNKPMIGCHWEFIGDSISLYLRGQNLENITKFLDAVHTSIQGWVQYKKRNLNPNGCNWREAFHPNRVQVWGRIAQDKDDSQAIRWFHQNYRAGQTIKQSTLTGSLGQIGRIWHRMYPVYIKTQDGQIKKTIKYIELLTIFPDSSQSTQDFLQYLDQTSDFTKLWGEI